MTQTNPATLSDTDVAYYLLDHPDFFYQHLELLEVMHIPHPSGTAISLISKQLELFRTKHHELENQLVALIDIARENDTSFNRLHQLTLALLEATSLEQVIAKLEFALAECFGTEFIAIKIIQNAPDNALSTLFVEPQDEHLKHFENILSGSQPKCGRPTLEQAGFLFGEQALEVKSCAIIPIAYTHIQALLAIGSRDETRFHYSMGSLFLTQISEIVATRLVSLF